MHFLKKIFGALTRKERVVFLAAAACAAVSLAAVIGIFVVQATTVVPASGGEYAEGMVGQPEYVNPVSAANEADLALVKMIYSNVYDIADKIETSPDGRIWTIRLREDLRWQDGEKLTSDDVIFTVQSIQNEDSVSPLSASWQGVAVTRASELELQFSLANPYAFFGDNLNGLYILPKHLFAGTPPGNWRLSDYNLKPVGSGPYQFVSYEKNVNGVISTYHLRAWDGYFGTKPLISRFDLTFFGNAADLVKNFNSGEIDGMGGVDAGDLAAIARPYDVSSWQMPSYYAVFFNQSKSLPLQDGAVRAALSMAADRNALVEGVLEGRGRPVYGPIPEGAPYFVATNDAGGGTSGASADAASSTLSAAGWKAGMDGFRAKTVNKTAIPLALTLVVPQIDFLTKTAEMLKTTWENIGVKVDIVTDSPANLMNGAIKNRDYEALLFGNVLGPSSDLYAFWDSSQRFSPGLNLAIYQNKTVDTLIESARRNMDAPARAKQFADAEIAIVADDPAVFLYSPDYLYVTNKNVRGIAPQFIPDQSDRFRKVGTWYLNTARVLK